MEPDQSGTGQTSPRGNDWEVVQLTASNYASASGPARTEPEPFDEESEGHVYGAEGADSAAAALLMSGHFSVPQNEPESLLVEADTSIERQEAHGSQYAAVSDKGEEDRVEKLKDDGLDRIPSFDKGKSLSSVDMEPDDGSELHMGSLVGKDPVTFSSSGYSATDAEKELGQSVTESTNEKTEEDPTLQNMDPDTDTPKAVASGEESKPDSSGAPRSVAPRSVWWRKQLISLYRSAKESNKLWPIVVAAAALMGMAYFRRRWQKGKLQLQQVKLQPASSKERINQAAVPLNRIKDILVAGNHPSPAPHGNARLG